MRAIHLIERINKVTKISDTPLIWESGDWDVSEQTASALVGGDLYLHTEQDAPSHFGGRIVGYRVLSTPPTGRVAFQFSPTIGHKDVRAGHGGWGNEQKRVE
jgi:hypothetical protein